MPSLEVKQPRPWHPYLVLFTAIMLPGVGQVVNNTPLRGLTMVFFMLVLGVVSFNLASPGVSIVGQFAGGIFIYAVSVLDAYLWARVRWAQFHH